MSDRRLFALSDPHLSFARPKPMDVFGPHWERHAEHIAENWRRTIGPDDIVLVPGDISWAMRLDDAYPDLKWLSELPGKKILVKGNHDYWWQSLNKVKALRLRGLHFVQNNHVVIDDIAVGGTRLWDFPFVKWMFCQRRDVEPAPSLDDIAVGKKEREGDPEKIRARELQRLELSLAGLPKDAGLRIALTHYPPLGENGEPTPITDLICGHDIDYCVFGHVHGADPVPCPGADATIGKTRFLLASTDFLIHTPKYIADLP